MTQLIAVLDQPDRKAITALVDTLGDLVGWYKVGSIVFSAFGRDVVDELKAKGKKVFLDLKFHDIPNTVEGSAREACRLGADMFTLHLLGGEAMVRAAVKARNETAPGAKILGVTVLTSISADDLKSVGIIRPLDDTVVHLAVQGRKWGVDAVVCSAKELPVLRPKLPPPFLLVCPGIRPQAAADDQKRAVTPAEAARAGADYIVVGRPVYEAKDPVEVVKRILDDLKQEGSNWLDS